MAMTRGQTQDLFTKFASEDPKYKEALVKDPKSVIEKQLNTTLPANVTVRAVVETADTMYVVVPHVAAEGELDDADLEKVAGGMGNKCDSRCGGGLLNTVIQVPL